MNVRSARDHLAQDMATFDEPIYTIREAAAVSTKSVSALRSMIERGSLQALGGGKRGKPRLVTRSALIRAGVFSAEGWPSALRTFQDQLELFEQRLDRELDAQAEQLQLFRADGVAIDRRLSEVAEQLRVHEQAIAELRELLATVFPTRSNQLAEAA